MAETISLSDVATGLWEAFGTEVFPVDNPAWERMSLWSFPVTLTKVSYVQVSPIWSNFITYKLQPEWTVVIKKIMMTSEGDQSVNGIEYRISQNRAIPGWLTTQAGIDLGKPSATSYPAVERPFAVVTDRSNPITIQVRNVGAAPVRAIAGLFGWTYKTSNDTGTGNRSGIADV